ncbi:MAG: hypothetical protein LBU81_05560 [Methanosarcinales archaeon]|jgi:hypothetical protein|nr:hypothetical protein [Methanosarcinales archaeon]
MSANPEGVFLQKLKIGMTEYNLKKKIIQFALTVFHLYFKSTYVSDPSTDKFSSPLSIINCRSISKKYGSVQALRDISFSADKGEIFRTFTAHMPPIWNISHLLRNINNLCEMCTKID